MRKNEVKESIQTIYFGGGTPSLLTINELQFIIDAVYSNYTVIKKPEITLEANPDDLSEEKIISLSKSPINRLSIGVQSFFNDDLKFMNRAHNADEAINSLKIAVKYFDNITIDLIYGIPNLTTKKWQKNLQFAFDLGINHISSYALTVESKTALYQFIKNGKYPKLDEEVALAHFNILVDKTNKQQFIHYETSNFAKEGFYSKHNTSYWQGKNYIGIGPSAHSYNGKTRKWNVANNTKYIKAIQKNELPQETEVLTENDLFNEKIMIGLRTIWGISLTEITEQFGQEKIDYLFKKIQKYITNKTLIIQQNQVLATKKGQFLIDGIASDLFIL